MIRDKEYSKLAKDFNTDISSVKAIDFVESNGLGFDPKTGKIIIQFEPHYFKRLTSFITGLWSTNKVDIQSKEWEAFNSAFKLNPNKAMESASIGRMQVMGIHWKRLGFKSVGDMWDFAKASEVNQLWLGLQFIATDLKLYKALKNKDWKTVAFLYNGKNYWIKGYDKKLQQAEIKYR